MNKKGSLGIAIVTALILIIIGFMMINFVMDEVTRTRGDLNCANAGDISDSTKLLCLTVDVVVVYFIWIILSVSIGLIISRTTL